MYSNINIDFTEWVFRLRHDHINTSEIVRETSTEDVNALSRYGYTDDLKRLCYKEKRYNPNQDSAV